MVVAAGVQWLLVAATLVSATLVSAAPLPFVLTHKDIVMTVGHGLLDHVDAQQLASRGLGRAERVCGDER